MLFIQFETVKYKNYFPDTILSLTDKHIVKNGRFFYVYRQEKSVLALFLKKMPS